MKKSKFLVLGLIALMLAGGLVLASCGDDKEEGCNSECNITGNMGSYRDCENNSSCAILLALDDMNYDESLKCNCK
jgi:hypothetical protein